MTTLRRRIELIEQLGLATFDTTNPRVWQGIGRVHCLTWYDGRFSTSIHKVLKINLSTRRFVVTGEVGTDLERIHKIVYHILSLHQFHYHSYHNTCRMVTTEKDLERDTQRFLNRVYRLRKKGILP